MNLHCRMFFTCIYIYMICILYSMIYTWYTQTVGCVDLSSDVKWTGLIPKAGFSSLAPTPELPWTPGGVVLVRRWPVMLHEGLTRWDIFIFLYTLWLNFQFQCKLCIIKNIMILYQGYQGSSCALRFHSMMFECCMCKHVYIYIRIYIIQLSLTFDMIKCGENIACLKAWRKTWFQESPQGTCLWLLLYGLQITSSLDIVWILYRHSHSLRIFQYFPQMKRMESGWVIPCCLRWASTATQQAMRVGREPGTACA